MNALRFQSGAAGLEPVAAIMTQKRLGHLTARRIAGAQK
jgi:hypothetical protein